MYIYIHSYIHVHIHIHLYSKYVKMINSFDSWKPWVECAIPEYSWTTPNHKSTAGETGQAHSSNQPRIAQQGTHGGVRTR